MECVGVEDLRKGQRDVVGAFRKTGTASERRDELLLAFSKGRRGLHDRHSVEQLAEIDELVRRCEVLGCIVTLHQRHSPIQNGRERRTQTWCRAAASPSDEVPNAGSQVLLQCRRRMRVDEKLRTDRISKPFRTVSRKCTHIRNVEGVQVLPWMPRPRPKFVP